jgi:phage tail P2-like protein
MPQPAVNTAGQEIYTRLGPLVDGDEANGWAALFLVAAIGAMAQGLDEVIDDTADQPGWTILFDPDTCPVAWLPWLAWLYGATLTPGMTEQQVRAAIRELPPHQRGTPAALRSAVAQTLTNPAGAVVRVVERDGSAYRLTVSTYEAQTPDPDASERAALSQTPLDTTLTFTVRPGWSWSELLAHFGGNPSWDEVIAAADTDTWTEIAHHLPDA